MKIGFLQFAPVFGEKERNLMSIEELLKDAQGDLVVLPELALSGYHFTSREEVELTAEEVPGPATERLSRLAAKNSLRIVIGLVERSGERLCNSSVLIGPGGVEGIYRKAHLFGSERRFFAPGDLGFPLFEVGGVQVGMLVCFDHLFPEAARTLALAGAEIIAHPSNLVLPEYAQLSTRVRSIENRVFWILANRYGNELRGGKTLHYTGRSQITAPGGSILAQAPEEGDSLIFADIEPQQARDKHVTQANDLFADRRPDIYVL